MSFRFTKMHGLGNDFIVIDAINQSINLTSEEIAALAKRDTGVGFDQCLLIEKSEDPSIDFFYRIYNANGQEVGQCGNGARCIARFAQRYGLTRKKKIAIATKTTRMFLTLNEDDTVTVDFGKPLFQPKEIPIRAEHQQPYYSLPLKNGELYPVHALSVGNPHAVSVVTDLASTPVAKLGKEISEHPWFPEQTNAGFMEIISATHIKLRVYERGCGETKACGSGAVAAAIVAKIYHQLTSTIEVVLPGGCLIVEWPNEHSSVFLRGPATFVYESTLCV